MNELKLSKEIYNYGLVKMAVKEFAGISNIVVNIEENFLTCSDRYWNLCYKRVDIRRENHGERKDFQKFY